ncbi:ferredoxin-like protein [Rhizobium leguminosarum bv. trifolii WSM2297]|uniref:Ferredoxin-like protein n=1 Tax=Rhizobium leguminosarum bv. trifolii WSM2297 TaxID=754762 RepID=J0W4V1_RHILT|nr:ferredoxin family protein [Rhizobium leguminosarum]EJC80736.1 ferredoxin-like protein [Rhizobium leguminosarum bv. trifolii WSM2297]
MKPIVKQRVEDKLYQNRYLVDSGRPHIKILNRLFPSSNLVALTQVCPAKCYQLNDRGQVTIVSDGCLECGTCRVLCEPEDEISWNHPRGGFGVLFKFG